MPADLYPPDQLFEFTVRVFRHFDVPEDDARTAATVLQSADLRGIDSHGVARLHTYFDMLELGRINPRAKVSIVRETASTATVDGDNGLGLVVGPKANAIAMEKALAAGSGWVSVRNTNHYGIAGWYVLEALKRELIERNRFPAGRIDSVPTGVDAARFQPGERAAARAALGLPADRILVGVVARLHPWKGHRFLIDAIARLPESIGLVIVGEGPLRAALEAEVDKRRLRQRRSKSVWTRYSSAARGGKFQKQLCAK